MEQGKQVLTVAALDEGLREGLQLLRANEALAIRDIFGHAMLKPWRCSMV